jgi:hypothetical protein
MKTQRKKQSRGAQAQELKVLFYRTANWRHSFVPLTPGLRLQLSAPPRVRGQALVKARLRRDKQGSAKPNQGYSRLIKVKQASKKKRKSNLDIKPSSLAKRSCE